MVLATEVVQTYCTVSDIGRQLLVVGLLVASEPDLEHYRLPALVDLHAPLEPKDVDDYAFEQIVDGCNEFNGEGDQAKKYEHANGYLKVSTLICFFHNSVNLRVVSQIEAVGAEQTKHHVGT